MIYLKIGGLARYEYLPAALFYSAVLGLYINFTVTGFYRFTATLPGGAAVILGMAILVAFDCMEYRRQSRELSRPATAVLQLTRAAAIVIFSFCDGLGFIPEPAIILIIFFSIFFILGKSYYLTGLVWFLYLISRAHIFSSLGGDWLTLHTYIFTKHITMALILALTIAFILSIAYRARSERAHRLRLEKLFSQLETSHRQLQEYSDKVADLAATEERNRLARDIHDSLGHYLTVINIQLEKALAFRERNPLEADQSVRDAKRLAGEALQDIRRSVSALRSNDLPFSIVEGLTGLTGNMRRSDFSIDLVIEGNEKGYSRQALMALYRAAQEGLTNVQKHSRATEVTVSLMFLPHQADLCIADNGRGFDPVSQDQNSSHYGFLGVRERLELVRGSVRLETAPGKGTRLYISVPRDPRVLPEED